MTQMTARELDQRAIKAPGLRTDQRATGAKGRRGDMQGEAQSTVPPPEQTLIEALMTIPKVGRDSDFRRSRAKPR